MMCCIKPSSQATFCQCGADMRNSAITGTCSQVHILYTSHNCLQNLIPQQTTFHVSHFILLFLHKLVSFSLFQWAFIINFYRRVSWLQLCSLIRSSIQPTVPYRISQETGDHTLLNFGLWISHVELRSLKGPLQLNYSLKSRRQALISDEQHFFPKVPTSSQHLFRSALLVLFLAGNKLHHIILRSKVLLLDTPKSLIILKWVKT